MILNDKKKMQNSEASYAKVEGFTCLKSGEREGYFKWNGPGHFSIQFMPKIYIGPFQFNSCLKYILGHSI